MCLQVWPGVRVGPDPETQPYQLYDLMLTSVPGLSFTCQWSAGLTQPLGSYEDSLNGSGTVFGQYLGQGSELLWVSGQFSSAPPPPPPGASA